MNITESPKFAALCQAYLISVQQELNDLRPCLDRIDFTIILQFAHKTKGTSGTYQLTGISEKAAQLQESAEAEDRDKLMKTYNELDELVSERLHAAL